MVKKIVAPTREEVKAELIALFQKPEIPPNSVTVPEMQGEWHCSESMARRRLEGLVTSGKFTSTLIGKTRYYYPKEAE